MLAAPGTTSVGGSTAIGPGAGAPGGGPPPAPTGVAVGQPAGTQVGQAGFQYGANPFTSGQYGAAPATSASQQATANALGTNIQNILGSSTYSPQGYGQANYNTSPLTQGASALSASQLANPNPYNSSNIQQMMQTLNTPIIEQQQQEIAGTQANMASRGLYDSSLAQGNLQDVYTAAGRQQLSAADTLLQNAAQAQLSGTNSAISNAAGLQGQAQSQLQTAQNNAIQNLLGYNQDQFNNSLATQQQNLAQTQQLYNMNTGTLAQT
jgi:hypothetical protein